MAENAQVRPSEANGPPAKRARQDNGAEVEEVASGPEYLRDLEKTQEKLNILNEKASEEILRVEQRFNEKRKPHFAARSQTIAKIPSFWVHAMLNHPSICTVISEEDEGPLAHLQNIIVEEFQDMKSGFKIDFIFEQNPYFTNAVLTKEFQVGNDGATAASHTAVDWNPGRNPIENQDAVTSADDPDSFFQWFSAGDDPLSLGEQFKDELWSDPVQYYLMEPASGGEENGEEDDEDDLEEGGEGPFVYEIEEGKFVDAAGNPVEPYEESDPEDEYNAAAALGIQVPGEPVYVDESEDDEDADESAEDYVEGDEEEGGDEVGDDDDDDDEGGDVVYQHGDDEDDDDLE